MRTMIVGGIALLFGLPVHAGDVDIRIENAWIREAPPVASVQAGYFTLCNDGEKSVTLESVESDAFGHIEMHETIEKDGASRMEKLDGVVFAAGECIRFERGGRHLMLFDAIERLSDGDTAVLTLLVDGKRFDREFPVRRGNGGHNHHGH